MANLKSLLPKASAVRDATVQKENTALRVGSLFVDIINETDSAISTEKQARESADTQLQSKVTAAHQAATTAQGKADTAKSTADAAKSTADAAKAVTDKKGLAGGLAELDESGKVTDAELPGTVYNVVEFDGVLNIATAPTIETSSAAQGNIYFLPVTNTFLRQNGSAVNVKYYANWPGADTFGELSNSGRTPKRNTIYIDRATMKQYYWAGTALTALDAELISRIALQTPVRCTDEADLESKAAAAAEGQQFYIPETE